MNLKILLKWWPTALTLAVVLYATWWPDPMGENTIPLFPGADKLIHAVMMGGLAAAAMFDYKRTVVTRGVRLSIRVIGAIVVATAIFSIIDEIVQGEMDLGRTCDFYDILADWGGIIIAALMAPPVINRIFRIKK